MKRRQAVRASAANVRLHIRRQQVFGPNMIRGNDRVRPAELLAVTFVALCALAFAAYRGWIG
jgi:hypothetical protein